MDIARGTLPKFAKLCIYSGTFTVISFVSFSAVYHFANPEVGTFARFFKNHALWNWFEFNFLSWGAFFGSLMFIVATILASSVGFVCAIFAKVLHDRAAKVLKAGIGT